jgi:hypothetical protein
MEEKIDAAYHNISSGSNALRAFRLLDGREK